MSVAKRLRSNWGYSREAADILANQILDPYSRCSICGVPQRMLVFMVTRRYPMPDATRCARLTVDHIVPAGPSVLGNTRLLCYACNHRRGPNYRKDVVVWRWIVRQWRRYYSDTQLWWLHDEGPGKGGRAYRGRKHDAETVQRLSGTGT